jgi:hypothetical protein
MATLAPVIDKLDMELMIEAERLLFLGVKKFRKNNPSDNQASNKSDHEKKENGSPRTVSLFMGIVCRG